MVYFFVCVHGSNGPFPSFLSSLCQNSSYDNLLCLQVQFRTNETNFHIKGFAQGPVLKKQGNSEMEYSLATAEMSEKFNPDE